MRSSLESLRDERRGIGQVRGTQVARYHVGQDVAWQTGSMSKQSKKYGTMRLAPNSKASNTAKTMSPTAVRMQGKMKAT